SFFEKRFHFPKVLLTTSGTSALEMAALLINIEVGDEVIMPSYTFSSTANAFLLRGAKIVFADSLALHPNIDVNKIESLITSRTKAIVPVHYAGVACDMDAIMGLATKYNLFVVEDAAQAINTSYRNKPLGSFGHLSAFSFHESKNIIAGEAGLLVINKPELELRAEIIREKGTDRSAFFRGDVQKYSWKDIGSSYLPSEILAAILMAQLETLEILQEKRLKSWYYYYHLLKPISQKFEFQLPFIPKECLHNAHIFFLVCKSEAEREALNKHLFEQNIQAYFHYQSLHNSPFFKAKNDGRELPNADKFAQCLIRLPMHYYLTTEEQNSVATAIEIFYSR
ncbi:MAG: dTDP-4-amino-4,6-dideoxygalactose transaminase, partial [Verrucomicrobia bacterium]|nr:dTDP-4-amino-4,6-dideoxygalactose transaminase [Cytophagales bacterium]